MSQPIDVQKIVQQVLEKKKYRHIDPALVQQIALSEASKRKTLKEAVKATTNKLHQVGNAYFDKQPEYPKFQEQLARLESDLDSTAVRNTLVEIMRTHASTRERVPILNEFFTTMLSDIQPIKSVLDLACGFNPLAIPWMPLEKSTKYTACDIFADMTDFLNKYFQKYKINGNAFPCNLLSTVPQERSQVAFLLKTLPCLEQAEKDCSIHILKDIPAEYILVSFPIQSISGKQKGMREFYSQQFESLLASLKWDYKKTTFSSELAYLVQKGKTASS